MLDVASEGNREGNQSETRKRRDSIATPRLREDVQRAC